MNIPLFITSDIMTEKHLHLEDILHLCVSMVVCSCARVGESMGSMVLGLVHVSHLLSK